MDAPNIPREALFQNLRELEFINTTLGGHHTTLKGLERLLPGKGPYTIADFGCGGGDMLAHIAAWAKKRGTAVRLIGIDYNADCIAFARERCKDLEHVSFLCSDFYGEQAKAIVPDVAINALFCHHLTQVELVRFFAHLHATVRIGFLVNDLHRHPLAYYSIKALTSVLSKSPLVKHDAPLSVARAFSRAELAALFAEAGIPHPTIAWQWAFRWLALARKTA